MKRCPPARAAVAMVTAAAISFGAAAPSFAQSSPAGAPKAAGSADASARARVRFNEGVALGQKNDWKNAYLAFLEAWKLKEHPQVALNLGRAELETGKYRDAIEHLQYCIDNTQAGDPDIPLARDWQAEARKKAAKLVISVDVAGARISVDEAFVGNAPLSEPVLVDPGSHVVKATLDQHGAQRGLVVETGVSVKVALILRAAALDTEQPPPQQPPPQEQPPPEPTGNKAFPVRTAVVIGGLAGTGIGLGIGATWAALSVQQRENRDTCLVRNDRACWDRLEGQRVLLSQVSFAGFVAGGLFAVGTATYWFFGPKEPAVAVVPAVSSTGGGLIVTGSW